MEVSKVFGCPMCPFEAPTVALLLSHLRLIHSSDPHFLVRCGVEEGCTYTARTFSALYSHVYRKHKLPGVINSCSSDAASGGGTLSVSCDTLNEQNLDLGKHMKHLHIATL